MAETTTAVQTTEKKSVLGALATRFNCEPTVLQKTLKETVFKGANDAQFVTLCVVANQYGLNPMTKELYAFPDRRGGIIPIVSVDGWANIMNSHPQFDGIEFEEDSEKCTAIIYRKDRAHPIKVTEWLAECRMNTDPWKKYPARMLRHKAMIQCARLAFSFSGIYDSDEAKRIIDGQKADDAARKGQFFNKPPSRTVAKAEVPPTIDADYEVEIEAQAEEVEPLITED